MQEEVVEEEGREVSLSRLEEEIQEEGGESEEEEEGAVFLDLSGLQQTTEHQSETVVKSAMQSTVDAQQWRLEVERVLPSLKVHVRQDNRVSHELVFIMT